MLLSPGSPVLKVVKHVVIKSAPDLMWSGIKGADNFFRAIVVRACGRFLTDSAHSRLSYCNSCENICQEVSRVNIWVAVVKEKGKVKYIRIQQIISSLNSFKIPIAICQKKEYNVFV